MTGDTGQYGPAVVDLAILAQNILSLPLGGMTVDVRNDLDFIFIPFNVAM